MQWKKGNFEHLNRLFFEAVAMKNNKEMYAASSAFNGLFLVDISTGYCDYLGSFPGEKITKERMFFSACYYDNHVFFAPSRAESMYIYDTERGQFQIIDLKKYIADICDGITNFSEIFVYNGQIYLIGAILPYYVVINPINYAVNAYKIKTNIKFWFRKGEIIDDKFYIASASSNLLFELDLKCHEQRFYEIPSDFKGAWSFCYLNNKIWLFPRKKGDDIWEWDIKTKRFEKIGLNSIHGDCEYKDFFLCGYAFSEKIVVFPIDYCESIIIDSTMRTIENNANFQPLENEKIGYWFKTEDKLFLSKTPCDVNFFDQKQSITLSVDKTNNAITSVDFIFRGGKQQFEKEYLNEIFAQKKCSLIQENSGGLFEGLSDFIEYLLDI